MWKMIEESNNIKDTVNGKPGVLYGPGRFFNIILSNYDVNSIKAKYNAIWFVEKPWLQPEQQNRYQIKQIIY